MADPLAEILRSPLDDLPPTRITAGAAWLMLAALILGVTTGLLLAARPEAVTPTTGTRATPVPDPLPVPPGWTDTGEGYSIGVSWIASIGDDLAIGVTGVTPAGSEPATVGATIMGIDHRGIGIWTVELSGGERLTNTRELFDLEAEGVVTVVFDRAGVQAGDVRGLTLRPAMGFGMRTHRVEVPITGLPTPVPVPAIRATERVTRTDEGSRSDDVSEVVVDELILDWSNASVIWSLAEDTDLRVFIEALITIEGDTTDPVVLQTIARGGAFLQRSYPPLSPGSWGHAMLRKTAGATAGSYAPERAVVDFTVSWIRTGATELVLDVDGATLVDLTD